MHITESGLLLTETEWNFEIKVRSIGANLIIVRVCVCVRVCQMAANHSTSSLGQTWVANRRTFVR